MPDLPPSRADEGASTRFLKRGLVDARACLAAKRELCFTDVVLVYGIASSVSRDVDDFYPTAGEAEATLAEILADEPELEGSLWVEPVDLDVSLN
jgi:hypothetical protein